MERWYSGKADRFERIRFQVVPVTRFAGVVNFNIIRTTTLMIGLDLDNPFVSAVNEFGFGQQSIDAAIDLLIQHESKHDLTLVAPGLDYDCRPGVIEVINDPRFGHLTDPGSLARQF